MPRNAPKRRLERSPLIVALTEIRFAPVLSMSSHISSIQERLRKSGFPGFEESSVQQFELAPNGEPTLRTNTRWVFLSADSSNAITLTTGGVSVQTTAYSDFENFLKLVETAITTLAAVVEPSFAGRVGLRYVDALRDVGNDISAYFSDTVLTFTAEDLGVQSLMVNQYVLGKTSQGHLQIRLSQVEDSPLLPPDLHSPELEALSSPVQGVHAILDIDSSDESRADFTWESVEGRLWAVHAFAGDAFWKSVTEEARTEWGERGEAE